MSDRYGNIVSSDNSSLLFLNIDSIGSNFSTIFEGSNSFEIKNGIYKISDLILVGDPGSLQNIKVSTDGIDVSIPDNL